MFVVCELAFICRVHAYVAKYSSKCLRSKVTIGLKVDGLQAEAEWFPEYFVPTLHSMLREARVRVLFLQPPAHQQPDYEGL